VPFPRERLRSAPLAEVLRTIREVEPPRPSARLSEPEAPPGAAAARRPEPRRLAALVKGELDWIVMKCLEKDRGRRYETARGRALGPGPGPFPGGGAGGGVAAFNRLPAQEVLAAEPGGGAGGLDHLLPPRRRHRRDDRGVDRGPRPAQRRRGRPARRGAREGP